MSELGTPRRKPSSRRNPSSRTPVARAIVGESQISPTSVALLSNFRSLVAAFHAAPRPSPADAEAGRALCAELDELFRVPQPKRLSLDALPPEILAHIVSLCATPEDISRLDGVSRSFHGQRRQRSVIEEGLRLRAAGRALPPRLGSGEVSWVQKLCWDERRSRLLKRTCIAVGSNHCVRTPALTLRPFPSAPSILPSPLPLPSRPRPHHLSRLRAPTSVHITRHQLAAPPVRTPPPALPPASRRLLTLPSRCARRRRRSSTRRAAS